MTDTVDTLLNEALARSAQGALEPLMVVQLAEQFGQRGRPDAAITLYRDWLSRHDTPVNYILHFNLAVSLVAYQDIDGADAAYRAAIMQMPRFAQAWFNLGTLMEKRGRPQEALTLWQSMLDERLVSADEQRDLYLMTLNNMGRLLEELREFERSETFLRQSLAVEPQQPKVIQHWVHLRQKQCAWPVYAPLPGLSPGDQLKATSPLAMLSASDDTGLQLATSVHFARERIDSRVPELASRQGYAHERIRVGFLSSDFCMHAVSLLTVELFELLDRDRFELYGFCWSRDDGSEVRARIVKAMDHFIVIRDLDDATAAGLIRSHEIDIVVDLQGLTSGARPNIIAARPAPVQITYLGFPGPTGLPAVDYVVADRFLIPDEEIPYYSEKPLYLPDVYQCSDRQRPVGRLPSRADCGLPEDVMVYCCFNNNYKFNEPMFDAWMRILHRVPHSVLWLLADNQWSEAHLKQRAQNAGIAAERLLFAPRVAPPDYLARYTAADLFLDCYPFNAGTTANDALFMGLPVLTRSGRAFASRMAGALLTSLGMHELITWSLKDYEERAVQLGSDKAFRTQLRERLAAARQSAPLFDMPKFVRGFEAALASIVAR